MKRKGSAATKDHVERLDSDNKSLRNEVLELQSEKEALEEELRALRSSLSASENQIKAIRGSVTYRVGSLVVNSRTPRGLVRLPWRLLKIYLEYKSRQSKKVGQVVSGEPEVQEEIVDDRPVYDQLWVGFYDSGKRAESLEVEFSEKNILECKQVETGVGEIFEFILPFENGELPIPLDEDFSIVINEMTREGEVLWSREFGPPVNSYHSAPAYIGNDSLGLSFVHHVLSSSCDRLKLEFRISDSVSLDEGGKALPEVRYRTLSPGVSVIVPSYKGEDTIFRCLSHLACQTLDDSRYEVIVVLNGEPDSSEGLVVDCKRKYPELNIKILKSDIPSAGNARNIGLSSADYEYVTFVDDDDFVSENYLEALWKASSYNQISIASVLDVDASGEEHDNVIRQQLENAKNYKICRYSDVSSILTMNACKMLPTSFASQLRYNASLRSGEDVCYFTRYITRFSPGLSLEPVRYGAVYYRFLSDHSVSRQPTSFRFNVEERLGVIQSIDKCLPFVGSKEGKDFLTSKVMAQSNFIRTYLESHRDEVSRYASLVQMEPINVRYDKQIASSLADVLVYSYCFAPYVDTAGIVMAKRIREEGVPVDVVCNTMAGVRDIDERLDRITAGLVGRQVTINGQPSFSSWPEIKRFADSAEKAVLKIEKSRGGYQVIYSRAMWVASHFAAVLHKVRDPHVIWRAEFSDPILKDVNGNDRDVELDLGWLKNNGVLTALSERGVEVPDNKNLFFWCEFLVYVLADEIVFTNENQLKYMLSYSGLTPEESDSVKAKSTVQHHPSLPGEFYEISNPAYELDEEAVNIAYFGGFYATRGLSEVFALLDKFGEVLERVKIHIFTSEKEKVMSEALSLGISKQVFATDYVAFVDFLALTNRFDCLVVNDAATSGLKSINPYLPSKLSDYMGSKSNVWAVVEEGSVLHKICESDNSGRMLMSVVGNQDSHLGVMKELLERKFGHA
ncbi:glycosyltransferase [Halomonas elongata]|uniref:glycosyltransferase n=1 Tax=Halomonas elongata TaxID=2746 RepID=UPI004034B157